MLTFANFKGCQPRIRPRFLAPGYATVAQNCDFADGSLAPQLGLGVGYGLPKPGTLLSVYPISLAPDLWLSWPSPVSVVPSQAQNADGRILFTGDGYPKQTDLTLATAGAESGWPTTTRRLGVQPPTAAPRLTFVGSAGSQVLRTVSYYYTMVTEWEEESSPSPATATTEVYSGQTLRLDNFSWPTNNGNVYSKLRIYRLEHGSSASQYQFLTEIGVATTSWVDDWSELAGDVCEVEAWLPPPEDNGTYLAGLGRFGSMLTGHLGTELFLSEPWVPYAWPVAYAIPCNEAVVGHGYFDETLVILTGRGQYRATGIDPAAMTSNRVPYAKGCVSAASIASAPEGVYYGGPDGLYLAGPSGTTNLTLDRCFSRQQWAALDPASLHGWWYGGRYYGFFAGSQSGFIFDQASLDIITLSWSGATVVGGHYVEEDDSLRLLLSTAGGYQVATWAGATTTLAMQWRSGPQLGKPTIYSCAKVWGDFTRNRSLSLRLWLDGKLRHSCQVFSDAAFRLPDGLRATEWAVEIEGDATVDQIGLAAAIQEFHG